MLNSSCAEEARIRYDAFGNVVQQTGTFAPRYTFSTKEYLSDARLYLYAYRVYDPVAGRWTQRDPIGYEDSPNLYQFCGNNPVNLCDVDGRKLFKPAGLKAPESRVVFWAKVGGSIGAAAGAVVGAFTGCGLGLLTGPGAVVASPAGAVSGAALGAAEGAALGTAAGAVGAAIAEAIAEYMAPSGSGGSDSGSSFEKMAKGDNSKPNKAFSDAMKELGIEKNSPNNLWQRIHQEISGENLENYNDILSRAKEIQAR